MKILSVKFLSISFVILSFIRPVAGQTPVGYVLEIQGDWHLNGNTSSSLKRWQKLPSAGTISIKSPTSDDLIIIANLGGGGDIIDSRHCDADDCSKPIKLPGNKPQRSLLQVVIDATTELLFGAPDRYSLHRNRNIGQALSEGVVRLDGGKIDFSPVLRETGRYYVRWRARPRSGQAEKWSRPVGLRTEQGRPALLAVSDFKPGLYEINLQRLIGDEYETFASAWVLVSTSPEYENAAASFQQAVDMTEQWGSKVEPNTSREFLRAHLDYLANKPLSKR